MYYQIITRYKACQLVIPVKASRVCTVFLEVRDAKNPKAVLLKRFRNYYQGEEAPLYVNMPITGMSVVVLVYENPENPAAIPQAFEVSGIKKRGLPKMDVLRIDPRLDEWIEFCGRFAFNATVLPCNNPGEVYVSRNGNFKIRYVPLIIDEETGSEDVTPARINIPTRVIEVSKKFVQTKKFVQMVTVPGLICILDHEYSHLFENNDMRNELEADINGITIYLSCGFPRYEAKEVYYNVFYSVASDENGERLVHIDKFIDEFDYLQNTA